MEIDRAQSTIFLRHDVSTEFPYQDEVGGRVVPLTITASRADYFHEQKELFYYGEVKVNSGKSTLAADELRAYLDKGQDRIECQGNVAASFYPESEGGVDASNVVHISAAELTVFRLSRLIRARGQVELTSAGRNLEAEEVELFYAQNEQGIVAVYARGEVVLQETERRLMAESIMYTLSSDRVIATGNPRLESKTDFISGGLMVFQPEARLLTVRQKVEGVFRPENGAEDQLGPDPKKKAAVDSSSSSPIEFKANSGHFDQFGRNGLLEGAVLVRQAETTLAADSVLFSLTEQRQLDNFEALGSVKMSDKDQNLSCQKLVFSGQDRLAIASGQCKAWQGVSTIEAPVFHIYTEMEKLYAFEGVKMHLEGELMAGDGSELKQVSGGPLKSENPLEISADTLCYTHQERELLFEGEVTIQRMGTSGQAGSMNADRVRVLLEEGGQGFKELIATGHIEIFQNSPSGKRKITGDRAGYYSAKDILWVEGSQVTIIDPENSIICTRAEFHIRDRRYLIEGNDAVSVHNLGGTGQSPGPGKGTEKGLSEKDTMTTDTGNDPSIDRRKGSGQRIQR